VDGIIAPKELLVKRFWKKNKKNADMK
jgi:hypothetical protein